MKDTLFELPVSLSPRLKWLQEHKVRTQQGTNNENTWAAWIDDFFRATVVTGATEQEAIERLAQERGWRLWNQSV